MSALIRGLVIPERSDLEPFVMGFPTKDGDNLNLQALYQVIGCELVEPIYPVNPVLSACVMYGDEMGRYREGAMNNPRATHLFNFPYYIVGTVVVFGDDPRLGKSLDVSDDIVNHPTMKGIFR